ncbi:exodeoxyribonuclease III [uncultured Cohaesibacter sp.]|uniref:exodeoxyribonuclease III n=1 Tax=uncultured Cohaesibacter sp. TaxID=1002546 RepID=UPI002931B10B|nr:exodeoxyribonuclease III [uncultured Cohaesibacter sp.]
MRIATWNINGIKARHDNLVRWLEQEKPDIACLQEIKSVDEAFPRGAIEDLGYNVETHGQKGFNGVALLSRLPIEEVNRGLPGNDNDEQARFIEGLFATDRGPLRVISLYLPNGNPVDSDKYPYKLEWMDRLIAFAKDRLSLEEPFILSGDYNVIPTADDVHDHDAWWGDALYRAETLEKFRELKALGLTEAFRACNATPHLYSFWDYQAGAWQKNNGIRIDHHLMSPEAADLLASCSINKDTRGWEKPSDHVPVTVTLKCKAA